jgi:hypothetical protein
MAKFYIDRVDNFFGVGVGKNVFDLLDITILERKYLLVMDSVNFKERAAMWLIY